MCIAIIIIIIIIIIIAIYTIWKMACVVWHEYRSEVYIDF